MKIYCTRPRCSRPENFFSDLANESQLETVPQKYCTTCGMPLILAGRYLPEKLLGQGGFGAAFLARDRYTPTKRQCVVKQFLPAGNLGPKELEVAQKLFAREAEVLEELGRKHPQIPDLYAFFPLIIDNERFFYLVQEFIDGQTLEVELQKKKRFSETEAIDFLQEMLPVVQFIHEHNSIHRDIKPSNIIRDKQGVLHLLDFGAVKQVSTQGNQSKSSTGIYSQGFAPPEQMAAEQVFPSTDLYALAATCVNLLTGKPVKELYDFYNNQWNWRPYGKVSDRLANILDSMLLPHPQDRPQSAQEVLNQLNYPTTTNTPVPITTPSPPTVTQNPPPPKPSPPPKPPKSPKPPISLTKMFIGAGFVGFEGTLLLISIASLVPTLTGLYIFGGSMVLLLILVFFRVIENWDFVLIGIISLVLVWLIGPLHEVVTINDLAKYVIVLFPIIAAAGAIAVTSIFRLIYQLLSLFF
jgi:serine/threonine protein kinase